MSEERFERWNPESAQQQWFALRVRSNSEKLVAAALRGRGYAEFLPMYRKVSRWSDRMKQIDLPLFPGYVFTRFDADKRLPILTISGVMHVVGVGKTPEPIEGAELKAVERFLASGLRLEPWPFFRTGQVVEVERGSLSGMKGILLEIKNAYRLVISLTLLQRSVAVEIDRDCVRPISSSSLAASQRVALPRASGLPTARPNVPFARNGFVSNVPESFPARFSQIDY